MLDKSLYWILFFCIGSVLSDVIFTSEKCDRMEFGLRIVAGDPSRYRQCGPSGRVWVVPCAPGMTFDAEDKVCKDRSYQNRSTYKPQRRIDDKRTGSPRTRTTPITSAMPTSEPEEFVFSTIRPKRPKTRTRGKLRKITTAAPPITPQEWREVSDIYVTSTQISIPLSTLATKRVNRPAFTAPHQRRLTTLSPPIDYRNQKTPAAVTHATPFMPWIEPTTTTIPPTIGYPYIVEEIDRSEEDDRHRQAAYTQEKNIPAVDNRISEVEDYSEEGIEKEKTIQPEYTVKYNGKSMTEEQFLAQLMKIVKAQKVANKKEETERKEREKAEKLEEDRRKQLQIMKEINEQQEQRRREEAERQRQLEIKDMMERAEKKRREEEMAETQRQQELYQMEMARKAAEEKERMIQEAREKAEKERQERIEKEEMKRREMEEKQRQERIREADRQRLKELREQEEKKEEARRQAEIAEKKRQERVRKEEERKRKEELARQREYMEREEKAAAQRAEYERKEKERQRAAQKEEEERERLEMEKKQMQYMLEREKIEKEEAEQQQQQQQQYFNRLGTGSHEDPMAYPTPSPNPESFTFLPYPLQPKLPGQSTPDIIRFTPEPDINIIRFTTTPSTVDSQWVTSSNSWIPPTDWEKNAIGEDSNEMGSRPIDQQPNAPRVLQGCHVNGNCPLSYEYDLFCRHPHDASAYLQCAPLFGGKGRWTERYCPDTLIFVEDLARCEKPFIGGHVKQPQPPLQPQQPEPQAPPHSQPYGPPPHSQPHAPSPADTSNTYNPNLRVVIPRLPTETDYVQWQGNRLIESPHHPPGNPVSPQSYPYPPYQPPPPSIFNTIDSFPRDLLPQVHYPHSSTPPPTLRPIEYNSYYQQQQQQQQQLLQQQYQQQQPEEESIGHIDLSSILPLFPRVQPAFLKAFPSFKLQFRDADQNGNIEPKGDNPVMAVVKPVIKQIAMDSTKEFLDRLLADQVITEDKDVGLRKQLDTYDEQDGYMKKNV